LNLGVYRPAEDAFPEKVLPLSGRTAVRLLPSKEQEEFFFSPGKNSVTVQKTVVG